MRKQIIPVVLCFVLGACVHETDISRPEAGAVGNVQTLSRGVAKQLTSAFELILEAELNFDQSDPETVKAWREAHRQTVSILNGILLQEQNINPYDQARILSLLGHYNMQLGPSRYTEAINAYERVVVLDILSWREILQMRFDLVLMYSFTERWDDARAELEEIVDVLETNGKIVSPLYWYSLAASYAADDRFEDARQPAEKAIAGSPMPPRPFFELLGAIYHVLDLPEQRRGLLESAVKVYPDDERFRQQLDALSSSREGQSGNLTMPTPDLFSLSEEFISHRDAQPINRYPPHYPETCRALPRGRMLEVEVTFDVSTKGNTENIRVMDTDDDCLDIYAVEAVTRWKYRPRIESGVTYPRTNVRAKFKFLLSEEDGS